MKSKHPSARPNSRSGLLVLRQPHLPLVGAKPLLRRHLQAGISGRIRAGEPRKLGRSPAAWPYDVDEGTVDVELLVGRVVAGGHEVLDAH